MGQICVSEYCDRTDVVRDYPSVLRFFSCSAFLEPHRAGGIFALSVSLREKLLSKGSGDFISYFMSSKYLWRETG